MRDTTQTFLDFLAMFLGAYVVFLFFDKKEKVVNDRANGGDW